MSAQFLLINKAPIIPFADFSLSAGVYVLGRGATCNLVIQDSSISCTHAKLIVTRQSISVSDLGSRNGTFVNGAPAARTSRVRDGDEMRFGDVVFAVERKGAESSLQAKGELDTVPHQPPADSTRLTSRQLQVLHCLVRGLSEKKIGPLLSISQNTVHRHLAEIHERLNVHSRAELLAKCAAFFNQQSSNDAG